MTAQGTYLLTGGKTVTSTFVEHMMKKLMSIRKDPDGEVAAMQLVEHCENQDKPITAPARYLLRQLHLIDGKGRIIGEDERQFILMAAKGTRGLDTNFIDPFI